MGEGVGGIGVSPDLGQGTFYLGARRVGPTDFRQRHAVVGFEPPILAVMRGERVQKIDKAVFPARQAGHPDQPALIGQDKREFTQKQILN